MKVVILCGGKGYRLREETEFKSKQMVEIGGKPIIWHIMKIYAHYGHKEFILPLGYKGESIKQFFVERKWRGNDFTLDSSKNTLTLHKDKGEDWIIHFVETGLETKTALRLHRVKHLLKNDENFLLTYGDGVSDININDSIEFHKQKNPIVTMAGVQNPSRFGIIQETDGKVELFVEKPKVHDFVNGGFMVMNKRIFDYLSDEKDVMLVEKVFPELTEKGEVCVFKYTGFWYSMDNYRDYLELNKLWEQGAPWKVWEKRERMNLDNGSSWDLKK